ncbi:unnamed protein product, partial [Rotaria socialis]
TSISRLDFFDYNQQNNKTEYIIVSGGHGRSDIYFICRLSSLTDAINFDANEVLDCKWIKLDDAFKVENPILHRTAEQLLFGLKHGFEQSIDFRIEKIPSIVTGINFNLFTRSIKSNK